MNAAILPHLHFKTSRLVFRPVLEADAELCCALYCDPPTMRHIGPALTREQALRSVERMLAFTRNPAPKRLFLTVCEHERAIGIASIQHIDVQDRTAELGLMLLPEARGRGYAKEAFAELAAKAFELLPLDDLWIQHSVENEAAERAVRSAGFALQSDPDNEAGTGKRTWILTRRDLSPSTRSPQSR